MVTIEALLSGLEDWVETQARAQRERQDGTSGRKQNVLGGFLGLLTECPPIP